MSPLVVLFDLDGVISDTASVHAKAWKAVFDDVLTIDGRRYAPFAEPEDYLRYLDGKTRLAGIEDFLRSRAIDLPLGVANAAGIDSIHGIGNTKNAVFRNLLATNGVTIFADALRLIEMLQTVGADIGLASSSKNARLVLEKAGLTGCFKSILDGLVAEEYGVASKPHPDFYRHAASLLGRSPKQCVVIEDAISGVVSAKQAGTGLVIGIARHGDGQSLRANGADMVLSSLDELDFGRPELFLRDTEGFT